jgi:signal transduction histidine kinase/CheY-like chemotaxis protein
LDGHDPVDRTSLTAATVEYPSVPPGRYVFRVRCVDSLTGSELGVRELAVKVMRPPLLSTVAKLLYALLLTGIVLLFIRFRRKEAARRMTRERLDTFIRFAHELKTPVSLIKAPLSDLQRDSTLPEDDRQSVTTAMRNADRLMSMINSLLDLREDTPEAGRLYLEPTDLQEYLEDEVEPFQAATRQKGINLTCTVDEGLGPVPLDREKMDRILQNLVSNAVKYTEKGLVEVSASPAGKMWRLVVRDTGIGIPAEARSRIFNGGVRAANARDVDETGYGIGLMITRQLVLQLGGSISLQSEEGSGSAFTLLFPMEYRASGGVILAPEPADAAEDGAQAAAVPNRILVVEDDPEMLAYLKSALGGEFETLTAPDGETAFRLAEESQPDLVLSDVIMPVMNGYDLCRRLKSTLATSHIPVILLTAMDDREHIILGLESGADDYVVKPFDPQVLSARISNLLHERERLRSLLLRAGREEKRREYSNQLDRDFMEKVLAVMEKSFADPLFQVDDLCREVAMSRTAFYNKLKAVTGKAPNDFIRIFRLERAAELLSSGELTVTEAADRVGFSDPKYFSSCFRRHFGVSPSKY